MSRTKQPKGMPKSGYSIPKVGFFGGGHKQSRPSAAGVYRIPRVGFFAPKGGGASPAGGVWRTINGHPVFIKGG